NNKSKNGNNKKTDKKKQRAKAVMSTENTPFQNGLNEKEFVVCLLLLSLAQQCLPYNQSFLVDWVKSSGVHVQLPNVLVESEFLHYYEREDVSSQLQKLRYKSTSQVSCFHVLMCFLTGDSNASPRDTAHEQGGEMDSSNANKKDEEGHDNEEKQGEREEEEEEEEDLEHTHKMQQFLEILEEYIGTPPSTLTGEHNHVINRRPSSIVVHSRAKRANGIRPVSLLRHRHEQPTSPESAERSPPSVRTCLDKSTQQQQQEQQEQQEGQEQEEQETPLYNAGIDNKETHKIPSDHIDTYLHYFDSLQCSDAGCIPAHKVDSFFQQSGLSHTLLSAISLMCNPSDTHWDDVPFCLAMHFINFARQGFFFFFFYP
ncbi:hypothetical protein RFI_24128, partial [Reticulomyxa filosa]